MSKLVVSKIKTYEKELEQFFIKHNHNQYLPYFNNPHFYIMDFYQYLKENKQFCGELINNQKVCYKCFDSHGNSCFYCKNCFEKIKDKTNFVMIETPNHPIFCFSHFQNHEDSLFKEDSFIFHYLNKFIEKLLKLLFISSPKDFKVIISNMKNIYSHSQFFFESVTKNILSVYSRNYEKMLDNKQKVSYLKQLLNDCSFTNKRAVYTYFPDLILKIYDDIILKIYDDIILKIYDDIILKIYMIQKISFLF